MDDQIFNVNQITDVSFGAMVKRRNEEASAHWEKKHRLKTIRLENNKNYLATYIEEQLIDQRYQEVYSDNRLFTAVRTLLPFLTGRVTAPEVTPANGDDASVQFAEDFEEALQRHADKQMARGKIRLAIQDVLRGQRVGYLKWRYDGPNDDVVLEYVPAESVVIGKRSKLFEEPDYARHTQPRTVASLIAQFPDKEKKILELFGVQRRVPSQLEKEYDIDEDWIWLDIDGEQQLVVGWSYQNFVFGKMTDPNFDEGGNNIIRRSMIPLVFFNFLNDGSGYIDQTSFIEQSKWSQHNYNKRGQVIAESAKYGGTGVPIFAKGAITQKDVSKIRFSPIQRVLLDTADVNKAFTTWQSDALPNYIVQDKQDLSVSIDNIWGIPDVLRGEQSDSRTLGQDMLIRDQAEGRQADPIDCIDDAMTRFYLLEAQFMYRYFDEKRFYNYMGNDGKFVSIVVSNTDIRKNLGIEINVKAGTSLPIDRAQKRATIMELLKGNKVSTLVAYKELGLFDDPEEAYKQLIKETIIPFSVVSDMDKTIKSREAEQDLQAVIAGEDPTERDDITDDYIQHLTNYLLTNKYHQLEDKNTKAARRVDQFVQGVIDQAKLKMAKLQNQEPITDPNQLMPPVRAKETINYRDVPPDIQKQMEINQGLTPSTIHDAEIAAGLAHVGANSATVIQPGSPTTQQPGMEGLVPGSQQQSPADNQALNPLAIAPTLAIANGLGGQPPAPPVQ